MKKLFPLIALMCLFVLQGCPQPGPEPEVDTLDLIKTEYTIGAEGGALSLSFKSNLVWKASSDATWLNVDTPTKVVTTETVKVTATANTSTESRSAKVKIEAGSLTATITVKQDGVTPKIDINGQTSFTVPSDGGDVTVDVSSNVTYEVEVNADWITRNGTTFTIAPNNSESDRTAVITFKYGEISRAVSVKQNGKEKQEDPTLTISPDNKSVSYEGETFSVSVTTNQGSATGSCPESWVTVSGTSITVAANESTESRTAVVTFTAGSLSKTLTISQEGKPDTPPTPEPYIRVDSERFDLPSAGAAIITINVESNVEYHVEIADDTWVTEGENGRFNIAANESEDDRSTTITFSAGDETAIVIIHQPGKTVTPPTPEDPVLINAGEATFSVPSEGKDIEVKVQSNVEYDVLYDAEWITKVSTKSVKDETIIFRVDPNKDGARTAAITFKYNDELYFTVTVVQAEYVPPVIEDAYLRISPQEVTVEPEGKAVDIMIDTNLEEDEYSIYIPGSVDWITKETIANGIRIIIAENSTQSSRTATISFRSDELDNDVKLTVSQKGVVPPAEDPFDIGPDLSKYGTANCYVVTKAGDYSFDASVMGNGSDGYFWDGQGSYFNLWPLSSNATSFYDSSNRTKKPVKVFVIWDDNGVVKDVEFDKDNMRVSFTATGNKGNALIGVYSSEAKTKDDNCRWSWHIWCTDAPQTTTIVGEQATQEVEFVLMDRNVGATSANPEDGEATYGFWYQWGRKDPLKMYHNIFFDEKQAQKSLEHSVNHPTYMYKVNIKTTEWFNNSTSSLATVCADLWGNPQWMLCSTSNPHPQSSRMSELRKTIYDPCPPGWMVPPEGTWALVNKKYDVEVVDNGLYIFDSFYPFAGFGSISNEGAPENNRGNGWYGHIGFHDEFGAGRYDRVMQVWTNCTGKASYWWPNPDHPYLHAPDMYGAINISSQLWLGHFDDVNDQSYFESDYSHIRQRAIPVRCMKIHSEQ